MELTQVEVRHLGVLVHTACLLIGGMLHYKAQVTIGRIHRNVLRRVLVSIRIGHVGLVYGLDQGPFGVITLSIGVEVSVVGSQNIEEVRRVMVAASS